MNPMVLVLDGPNLDMPGPGEPEFRGGETPAEIERAARGVTWRLGGEGFLVALEAMAMLDPGADGG